MRARGDVDARGPRRATSGTSSSARPARSTSSTSHDGQREQLARRRRPRASPSTHRAALEVLGPPLVLAERRRRGARRRAGRAPRSASTASRSSTPVEAQDRALVGARRGGRSRARARRRAPCAPSASSAARGRVTWKRAVEAVRAPDARRRRASRSASADAQSTMSTSTRRSSLTAAALTTVRSALAVRPPRPMTLP